MKRHLRKLQPDETGRVVVFLSELPPGTELRVTANDRSTYLIMIGCFVEILSHGLVCGVMVSPSRNSPLVDDIVGRVSFDTLVGDQLQVGRPWQVNENVISRVIEIWRVE